MQTPSPSKSPARVGRTVTRMDQDGAVYQGDILNGLKHGIGTLSGRSLTYTGQWQHDMKHGKGRLLVEGQLTYEGEWRNNMMDGYGVFYASAQGQSLGQSRRIIKYEGEFRNNKRNGFGRLYFADGRVFEGEFRDNRLFGAGLVRAEGQDCSFSSQELFN